MAGLSAEEARRIVLEEVEREARHESAMLLEQIEEETKRESDRRAREIISVAIQRCAVDQVAETTVAAVVASYAESGVKKNKKFVEREEPGMITIRKEPVLIQVL